MQKQFWSENGAPVDGEEVGDTQIIAGLDTRLVAKLMIPSYVLVLESTHSIPEQHSVVSSQWDLKNSASLASSSSQLAPQMSPSNTTQSRPTASRGSGV